MKNRIEYIDLAKGLCILLVVSYHIDTKQVFYANEQVSNFFFAFRMPLYYMLSGIFLSINEEKYMDFVQKKINRLLVPFVFFVIVTNIYYYVKHLMVGTPFQYVSPLFFLFTENRHSPGLPNNPLWFLPSLFTTYMIFVFMHYIFKGQVYKISLASLIFGIAGYMFGMYNVKIPFYLDTSLTCMPFVCVGMIIRTNTNLLAQKESNNKLCSLVCSFVCFLVVYTLCDGENLFYLNEYNNSYFSVLFTGISGSLGVLCLCKAVVKIPVISYIGRYSVIVLGTHTIIIKEMEHIFLHDTTQLIFGEIATFVVVVIVSYCLIYLFIKYIPFLVAQKDFVQFIFK